MKTVLSIAGSDPSGGAGIQADLKTMALNGVYGMSVITALTAQNTTGVTAVEPVSPLFLQQQLDAVFFDIPPDGVKIGMVSAAPLIQVIARCLEIHRPRHVLVDPVMLSTSGTRLLSEDALAALQEDLLPRATLITPNLPEAEVLSGQTIAGEEDMVRATQDLSARYRCAVLCKGGHSPDGGANDLLCHQGKVLWFRGKRIDNPNAHGTGCTLSSAIAANLAKGFSLEEAIRRAKQYLSGALAAMLDLGRGAGPLDHTFALTGFFAQEAE